MKLTAAVFSASPFVSSLAYATPTTTFWAPSIATCQAAGVPHVTYDPYFGAGGFYHGTDSPLFTSSNGTRAKTGALLGWSSPDITVNCNGLKKIDVIGSPVFFLDRALQPGGAARMWTTQLDVDTPLGR
jgi:hypothetical protein